ncbi:TetR/AcrR family transcriptional regulator [Spongisporangium articulatum]|uniref:TetR/AcrR family transcriptional regulator n=1 Tax=Spongisporangium articulatum TaxID=3362603 RepID=A0ABW8AH51_9ACTN
MSTDTRRRLTAEDRRRQLIGVGLRLLTTTPVHELSVDDVAAEVGISRSLLFHYFPTKTDYFRAVVRAAGDRFVAACSPDPALPREQQLAATVDGLIDFVERRRENYLAFVLGAAADPVLQEGTDEVRDKLVAAIMAALELPESALAGLQVRGWLAYAQELVVRWATHHEVSREELRDLLVDGLHKLLGPRRG